MKNEKKEKVILIGQAQIHHCRAQARKFKWRNNEDKGDDGIRAQCHYHTCLLEGAFVGRRKFSTTYKLTCDLKLANGKLNIIKCLKVGLLGYAKGK